MSDEELRRAKDHLNGSLMLGLESTDWLVLLVGIALAGLLTVALGF